MTKHFSSMKLSGGDTNLKKKVHVTCDAVDIMVDFRSFRFEI